MGTRATSDLDQKVAIKGFIADFVSETLRDKSGTPVELRPQAFAVLRHLAENANRLISKDELMQAVWPGVAVTDDSLVQCVHEIRRALGDNQHATLKTVSRRGYRLVLPVESVSAAADSQRRMAAILAADVVGYSQLMGRDEEATLNTLKRYRSVIDALIARHQGRIFGSAGDSVIAEFASPVEAVRSATEIQLEISKRNAELPEASRMRFRIGINLGDVVVDGDNLLGDGVNVAARLEALSPPGGICISEAIHAHVRDRLSLDFLDLGEHKVKNISRPLRAYRVPLASEEQAQSPFRGLDVFDFAHASIFFGRTRAIGACIQRLEQLAADGSAFLLIYGMSGSGKSSLLRAGLLPAIVRPGATAGIAHWRRCLIRPSEGSDAVAALAAGLVGDNALPELAQDWTVVELADLLRSAPERAPGLIRAALGKVAAEAGVATSQTRLVIAVDQMEELFTTQIDPASAEALVRLLAAFAASGFVWVIATIRADFFHRCSEIPGLSVLKDGFGSYELLPPSGPEIAQIIREPARAVGLRFEENPGEGRLEDVLQEAAAADPASLPLLEFVLDALYEACRERRLLTFAAYRALGGLEGAIARRADEVVDALPPDVQAALPSLLRGLTTVRPGEETVTTSPANLSDIAGTAARSILVNALVSARLLISDEGAEGVAVIRVAHEALLSRWPRAKEVVNANRAFLETRARLQSDARRWDLDNRNPDLLLPAGKRLAEGEDLLQARREEVDELIAQYIETSSIAEKARQDKERQAERDLIEAAELAKRERLEREAERRALAAVAATQLARRTRYAAVVAIVLALIAGAGAILGFHGQGEAERQAAIAEKSASQAKIAEGRAVEARENALEARDQALRSQSLALSFLSQQTAAGGDTEAAVLLALEALPSGKPGAKRPYLFEAEAALYNAVLGHRQIRVFPHEAGLTHAAFSPRGDKMVTSSFDGIARVWDVSSGTLLATLKGHQGVVERATFSPDGSRIITASRDGTARIWDAATGVQLFVLPQSGDFPTAIFSPDGTRALTAGYGTNIDTVLWDARNGKKIFRVEGQGTSFANFSPDGRTFAAAEDYDLALRIWNTDDGKRVANWIFPFSAAEVKFSPDGKRILASSVAGKARNNPSTLWDVSKGTMIATFRRDRSDAYGAFFNHDGTTIATASVDGAARLWDGFTGQLVGTLGEEAANLVITDVAPDERDHDMNAAFSPDDRLLATAGIGGIVRIWDVNRMGLAATISGHHKLVEHLEFNPDGTLLTASHDGTARLWDVDGILTTTLFSKRPATFAVFSPDNVHLLTGGGDSKAHLWDLVGGREIAQLDTREPVQNAVFSVGSPGTELEFAL